MSLFQVDLQEIYPALLSIVTFFRDNPLLAIMLLASYLLFYAYTFINHKSADSEVYEIDLLSSGVSSITLALLLVGLDESTRNFDLSAIDISAQTTKVAIALLVYSLILIFFAFSKILPKFMIVILGNSEIDMFINIIAVLLSDTAFELTGTHLLVVGAPLLVLFLFQRLRKGIK